MANSSGTITESYNYDAYGVMLGTDDTAAANADTSLLYAGEQYDSGLSQYYLRARYYDPLNGRFNRMDPFSGSSQDPQSLHKYLYVHNNPINGVDPSGQFDFSLTGLMSAMAIGAVIGGIISGVYYAGKQILTGGDFDLREFLIEVGLGALIGALAGAAGYIFSFVAKSFLGLFRLSNTALTVGTGALTGSAAAFVGQVLTELKYWLVDKKPFVLRDAINRVLLASFAGLVMGGLLTKFSLYRGWISDTLNDSSEDLLQYAK